MADEQRSLIGTKAASQSQRNERSLKLFRYKPDVNRYACVEIAGDFISEYLPIVDQFNEGNPLAAGWQPVEISVDKSMGKLCDFPGLPEAIPVFSRNAWEVLRLLLGNDVEALPLMSPYGEFFAINVLSVVDCLDQSRSLLTKRPDGSLSKVLSYAFKSNCWQGKHMIKLPETRNLETLVSEEFVDLVGTHSLVGLRFTTVPSG